MTPELRGQRLGKLGASEAPIVMGGLDTSGLATLVKRKAWERVHGDTNEEGYRSKAMARGEEVETDALDWYEFETETILERAQHIDHPTIPFVAASPDGLLRGVKTVEAKSTLHGAWMEVKRKMQVPAEYRWQCRWQPWCAQLVNCDFVIWHPVTEGLIVPFEVTAADCEQMAERVAVVEKLITRWVDILQNNGSA